MREQVDLVQHDHLPEPVEARTVLGELMVDLAELLVRLAGRRVDHMDEQPGPLEVREELMAETDALARALDQTRARPRRSADGRPERRPSPAQAGAS